MPFATLSWASRAEKTWLRPFGKRLGRFPTFPQFWLRAKFTRSPEQIQAQVTSSPLHFEDNAQI